MTATASPPVLYLLPRADRRRPVPTGKREPLAGIAAGRAATALGTLFAPVAAGLARSLEERAPLLAARGRPELWAAAIAFLIAEESGLFELDCCVTRTSLARELDSTLPTLRRRVAAIRVALHPLVLDLPEPEGGYPDSDTS